MAYDVKQHFDHFTMRNGYGGGGYNTGGFGRRRREAPDATGKLLFLRIEVYLFYSCSTILGQLLLAMDPVRRVFLRG